MVAAVRTRQLAALAVGPARRRLACRAEVVLRLLDLGLRGRLAGARVVRAGPLPAARFARPQPARRASGSSTRAPTLRSALPPTSSQPPKSSSPALSPSATMSWIVPAAIGWVKSGEARSLHLRPR